jgi:hypothetical protein
MRNLVELFKILKANKQLLCTGLCGLVTNLCGKGIITYSEGDELTDYIHDHRPTKESKYYCKSEEESAWYWSIGKWYPRLLWINAQIRELSKKK